jgi:hypothetical protein
MDIFKTKKEILIVILSLITFAGIIWNIQTYLDNRYAFATEVKKIEQRLDIKILNDQFFNIQERIWRLEDYYEGRVMPITVKDEYRKLINEKDLLENELNQARQK